MRVLQPSFLFFLSFPIATLSSSNLDTGLQADANRAVVKSSSEVVSWASFLNPFHIVESIKGTLFPVDPDAMALVHPEALLASDSDAALSDFWGTVEKYEHIVQGYVPQLLNSATVFFDSTKFTDVMSAMDSIVNTTAAFHDSVQATLRPRGMTLDMLTEELETVFMAIAEDLKKTIPPDKTLGCAEMAKMVDEILDKVATGLEHLFRRLGIEEGVAMSYIRTVKPHVHALMDSVCEINEQYPCLLPVLVFCVAVLLFPQRWILRSFLELFGFGLAGPVKGSVAAWLQRYFWGAAVKPGSWFALLQAAGMGVLPNWARFATAAAAAPFLVAGCLMLRALFSAE